MWRTLRAALTEVAKDCRPAVWFLSARYGFHPADMPIMDYEQRMTTGRADELLRIPSSNRTRLADVARGADNILLEGGPLYRETMGPAIRVHQIVRASLRERVFQEV